MAEEINVNLDTYILDMYLKNLDWNHITEYLSTKFKTDTNVNHRFKVDTKGLNALCDIFSSIINLKNKENEHLEDLLTVLRILRNSVSNREAQNIIITRSDVLTNANNLLLSGCNNRIIKVVYQFLINLVVGNKDSAHIVYKQFENVLLVHSRSPLNYLYELSALLYNISLSIPDFNIYMNEEFFNNVIKLYEGNCEGNSEYLEFLIEKFLYYKEYWIAHKNFQVRQRIIVLQILRNIQLDNKLQKLPQNCLFEFINKFNSCSEIILKITENECNNDLEPYEISLLLEIISSCCSDEEYLTFFQKSRELMVISCALLQNIHKIGSESNNVFSAIQKLSEINDPSEVIQNHPSFGFKVNLVRLVGNLCWKCQSMQDLAREAELIPVLLNCCNIDARNPFIMQWVILAVRNLCEKNMKNQAVIASMHQEGFVSSSALEEMGITLHKDGKNEMKIVPLESLRK